MRYLYRGEQFPVFVEKVLEVYPNLVRLLKEAKEDVLDEEYTPFENIICDKEYEKEMNHRLRILKRSGKYSDLAEYYLCLQYVFGAIKNAFSYEQNQDFGLGIMYKMKKMGNRYANKYYKLVAGNV